MITNWERQSEEADDSPAPVRTRRHTADLGVVPRSRSYYGKPIERVIVDSYLQLSKTFLDFESLIKKCKLFNQQQVQRKYEAVINSLMFQIKALQERLDKEVAKNPRSAGYEQMRRRVAQLEQESADLRKENDALAQRLGQAELKISKLQVLNVCSKIESEKRRKASQVRLSTQQPSSRERLNRSLVKQLHFSQSKAESEDRVPTPQLLKEIKGFLQGRQKSNRLSGLPKSLLQTFLWNNLERFWNFRFSAFLSQLNQFIMRHEADVGKAGLSWKSKFDEQIIRLKYRQSRPAEQPGRQFCRTIQEGRSPPRRNVGRRQRVRREEGDKFWRVSLG